MRIPSFEVKAPVYQLWIPTFQVPFLRKRPAAEWAFYSALLYYAAFCVLIYFEYVQPWISGRISTRIGADSDRYWEAAELARTSKAFALVTLGGNYLGPVTIANALGDGLYVLLFNFCILLLAIRVAWTIPKVNKALIGFLFLANAELIPAITTLNKEIISLLAAVMTTKYLYSKKKSFLELLLVLMVSVFARWEQAALLLLYLVLDRLGMRTRHPWLTVVAVIVTISVCYPYTYQYLGNVDWLLSGATTLVAIDNVQKAFGFPLTVVPKIFMLMTGNLHSPQFYNSEYWLANVALDPQNILFLPLGCLAFMVVLFYAVKKKCMAIDKPLAFLIVITIIVTAVPIFIQPRYLYGIYAMLCIEISRPQNMDEART